MMNNFHLVWTGNVYCRQSDILDASAPVTQYMRVLIGDLESLRPLVVEVCIYDATNAMAWVVESRSEWVRAACAHALAEAGRIEYE